MLKHALFGRWIVVTQFQNWHSSPLLSPAFVPIRSNQTRKRKAAAITKTNINQREGQGKGKKEERKKRKKKKAKLVPKPAPCTHRQLSEAKKPKDVDTKYKEAPPPNIENLRPLSPSEATPQTPHANPKKKKSIPQSVAKKPLTPLKDPPISLSIHTLFLSLQWFLSPSIATFHHFFHFSLYTLSL